MKGESFDNPCTKLEEVWQFMKTNQYTTIFLNQRLFDRKGGNSHVAFELKNKHISIVLGVDVANSFNYDEWYKKVKERCDRCMFLIEDGKKKIQYALADGRDFSSNEHEIKVFTEALTDYNTILTNIEKLHSFKNADLDGDALYFLNCYSKIMLKKFNEKMSYYQEIIEKEATEQGSSNIKTRIKKDNWWNAYHFVEEWVEQLAQIK